MKLIFILLFSFQLSWAQDMLSGRGKFSAQDDDNQSFIRTELITSAIFDVADKQLKNLNLDAKLFWERFEERFNDHFNKIRAALISAAGLKEEDPVPSELRDKIRIRRITERQNFLSLKNIHAKTRQTI